MKKQSCIRVFADEQQIKSCKKEIENVQDSISKISRVLNLAGNEVRLKILYLLNLEEKMCPCDLSDVLGMTVPAISQHLKKMKDAGLVIDKKVGQTVFYSLMDNDKPLLESLFERVYTFSQSVRK